MPMTDFSASAQEVFRMATVQGKLATDACAHLYGFLLECQKNQPSTDETRITYVRRTDEHELVLVAESPGLTTTRARTVTLSFHPTGPLKIHVTHDPIGTRTIGSSLNKLYEVAPFNAYTPEAGTAHIIHTIARLEPEILGPYFKALMMAETPAPLASNQSSLSSRPLIS